MENNKFIKVAAFEGNPKWDLFIKREQPLYMKENDIRSEFERDYTRILHSTAYRRLKHKTQVFPATRNDHICTRIEHVSHVASVSHTISKFLGLNTQLTTAIAIGHDLGHAPFGHAGEKILKTIAKDVLKESFWHEKNSLRFIDAIETLPDTTGKEVNLNLTYAVRDGIISHCGEVDENRIYPREKHIDLKSIDEPSKYAPYSWEGCVVKIADKISYLGRDIEDALLLKILTRHQLVKLKETIKVGDIDLREVNNTILIHDLITNLCKHSSPENGICFSKKYLDLLKAVKDFNYENIYFHDRLKNYNKYIDLVIKTIFEAHMAYYDGENTIVKVKDDSKLFPLLVKTFSEWLSKYSSINRRHKMNNRFQNTILYDMENKNDYAIAVIDYISGMTDYFAINIFDELKSF